MAALPRFLLIPGSWHGAWCFDPLLLELRRRAVECEAIDLPGLGDDETPLEEATFASGVDKILEKLEGARNVTLVGHSLGGFYATEAALRAGGSVRGIVYIASQVPLPGDTFHQLVERAPFTAAMQDAMQRTEDALTIEPARAAALFYHDAAEGFAAAACTRLKPQPVEPFRDAELSAVTEGFEHLRKSALFAEEDRVLPVDHAILLADRAHVRYDTVHSGHCPFLSMPKVIADRLLGVRTSS
jgi:pimeloyl-ACP methyl ester carboxylesterase